MMLEWIAEASPGLKGRIAGIFYVLVILTGVFAAFASGRLSGYSDPANFAATVFYVVVTLLFYDIFKPVNRNLSLLAALFSLTGCAISVVNILHPPPFRISPMVFFGFYCVLIGYLIFRSAFLPQLLGLLMAVGGLCYLTFLSPPLLHQVSPYILVPGLVGEGALTLWLLVKSVNVQRWKEQAAQRR